MNWEEIMMTRPETLKWNIDGRSPYNFGLPFLSFRRLIYISVILWATKKHSLRTLTKLFSFELGTVRVVFGSSAGSWGWITISQKLENSRSFFFYTI